MTTPTQRACCSLLLVLALHAGASAQTAAPPAPMTFAVLSLVGDEFTVVTREHVGSRLDQNTRRSDPIDTAVLDEDALDAAEKTIGKLRPGASVLRFSGVVLAWDALTVEQKPSALERNLRSAVETATTAVLAD